MTVESSIVLFDAPLSGHCHRVRLLLSLLDLSWERREIDMLGGEHKRPWFAELNPAEQVPVLQDGKLTLSDSNAILVYLALRYDPARRWLPSDPVPAALVQGWLSRAAGELSFGPAAARRGTILGAPVNKSEVERQTSRLFGLMQRALRVHPFLVGPEPTLADVAHYAYTARASEGGLQLDAWPELGQWLAKVEALPGFVPMPEWPRTTP